MGVTFKAIEPLIRHALQAIGGALVTLGYLDQEIVPAITGLVINGAAVAWYFWQKRK